MYQKIIRETIAKLGYIGKYDPRHIEGFMRLEHPTLNGLSKLQAIKEIKIAIGCINSIGSEESEKNALSFGL